MWGCLRLARFGGARGNDPCPSAGTLASATRLRGQAECSAWSAAPIYPLASLPTVSRRLASAADRVSPSSSHNTRWCTGLNFCGRRNRVPRCDDDAPLREVTRPRLPGSRRKILITFWPVSISKSVAPWSRAHASESSSRSGHLQWTVATRR